MDHIKKMTVHRNPAHCQIMKIKEVNSYALKLYEILNPSKPGLSYLPQQTCGKDIFVEKD